MILAPSEPWPQYDVKGAQQRCAYSLRQSSASVGLCSWLSFNRILVGFAWISAGLGLISAGLGLAWAGFGLDFALSIAFPRMFVHYSVS